jgi:hypothetical protein
MNGIRDPPGEEKRTSLSDLWCGTNNGEGGVQARDVVHQGRQGRHQGSSAAALGRQDSSVASGRQGKQAPAPHAGLPGRAPGTSCA